MDVWGNQKIRSIKEKLREWKTKTDSETDKVQSDRSTSRGSEKLKGGGSFAGFTRTWALLGAFATVL